MLAPCMLNIELEKISNRDEKRQVGRLERLTNTAIPMAPNKVNTVISGERKTKTKLITVITPLMLR